MNTFFNAVLIILLFFAVLVIIFNSTHMVARVSQQSMEPNVHDGSTSYAVENASYSYNNIVLATSPQNQKIIKRVVALGGDKIGFYHNPTNGFYEIVLIKNGTTEITLLDESYLSDDIKKNAQVVNDFIQNNAPLETIEYSGQSVKFLTLENDEVFLLGDNRPHSNDCGDYGPLKKDKVFAKVDLIVHENEFAVFKIIKFMLGF